MANNFLTIDRTKRYGMETVHLADLLSQSVAKIQQLSAIANNMTDTVDYNTVATQFGVSVGQAPALVSLLTSTLAKMQDAVIGQFTAYVGGVTP